MKISGIDITHQDKLVYPELGVNKLNVAIYYNNIAVKMLPYLKDRPLTLRQYRDGINHEGFYHKHAAEFYPPFIKRVEIPMSSTKDIMVAVCANSERDLVYFAEQNTIEFHTTLSCINNIELPDQIILDFDPSDNNFEKVRATALLTKDILDSSDLVSFVKTTGSRGLHIHVPLKPKQKFKEIKVLAKQLAQEIHSNAPELTTNEQRISKRGDKVFIDYLRNDYNMTAIAPYSLRANKGAGIATPISWDEVMDKSIHAQSFTIMNIQQRLQNVADPWNDFKKLL